MSEIDLLLSDIEKLRNDLSELVTEKQGQMLDPEILIASQMLNAIITKYHEIIFKK
ncbi:MAG TPA: aspartyl-phosphate phosphatase Spo0E family protein [Bacillota bacterium]|nr:aspartyl-phosphate phosphatase Spo0E family protein [Bacillota bacterium]